MLAVYVCIIFFISKEIGLKRKCNTICMMFSTRKKTYAKKINFNVIRIDLECYITVPIDTLCVF